MSNYFNGSGTIGFTCDSCGRETQGCTLVNGMKFCAKCYQETFGETDKDKRIADLEAKLAEKDKTITKYQILDDNYARLEEKYDLLEGKYETLLEDNLKYEEKLAEKDKEIDNLQDKLHHYYEEVMNKGTCGLCEHLRGEYKIDFAIEQLEKVKHELVNKVSPVNLSYTEYVQEVFNKINQQIKELKVNK